MRLDFENIHFAHTGKPALFAGENLTIPSGTSIGFVGPSGCGKTTFAQLALRFYDPIKGCVRINGTPLPDYGSTQQLRKDKFGFVAQQPCIFAGSVRQNLTFGNSQPDARLIEMIDRVRPELWHTFTEGLDTKLGEGGVRLSGGERQCIAIMREILKPAECIIFDEATSALDAESQAVAQSAIDSSLSDGRTIIIIAHRIETVEQCDLICSFGKLGGVTRIEAVAPSLRVAAQTSPTLAHTLTLSGRSW